MQKLSYISMLLCLLIAVPAFASRIIPHPPATDVIEAPRHLRPIQLQKHHVTVNINEAVATTEIQSVFYNPNPQVLEGTYLFPLPQGASISRFSLWIDGKEMPAELLDATKARNLYISIVRRMIDPALLEFVGRQTFKMRIFPLPANGSRKIRLSYQQVLPVDGNLMRYVYPLTAAGNGAQDTIAESSFQVNFASKIPIKSIFSPTHKLQIDKQEKKASATFSASNVHPDKDFVLYISRSMGKVDLSMITFRKGSRKGYFLMMLAPKSRVKKREVNPKNVVFVVDTSASMVTEGTGEKMEQAKSALKYCLHQLHPQDNFNIVPFATVASPYKENLLPASRANIREAVEFVEEDIYATGATNIDEALKYAVDMAPKTGNRPFMIIFITDGKPTVGDTTDPAQIIKNVKKAQARNLRLFTFGLGVNLNTKLLDMLAEENNGAREYVGAGENIELKVSTFFDKVSSPVLSNIKIDFPSNADLRISEVYPRTFPDLFKGSRLLILGRYKGYGDQAIRVTGLLAGEEKEFVFETSFPEENRENEQIAHLWAVRKVGFLLDQIRLHGENAETKREVVRLAKRFGIVTPYTSYLVVEDNINVVRRDRVVVPQMSLPERKSGVPRPSSAPAEEAFGQKRRTLSESKKAMEKESGESAVKMSKDLQVMKKADVVDHEKGTYGGKRKIRKIADKTFYFSKGIWYDSEYQSLANKDSQPIRIRFLSKRYFKLCKLDPKIGKFLAIGSHVFLVWEGKLYEIYP